MIVRTFRKTLEYYPSRHRGEISTCNLITVIMNCRSGKMRISTMAFGDASSLYAVALFGSIKDAESFGVKVVPSPPSSVEKYFDAKAATQRYLDIVVLLDHF